MERIKRQQNDSVHDNTKNKKPKLKNEITINNRNKSCFENLPNEIIYEIFEYLDVYHIYQGFFYLTQRFKNLLVNTNLPIQINIPTISKSNFELYHKNMIKPNKHRINHLRLSNPFTADIIFSPPRLICQFIQLETLILDNIDAKYLHNILKHSIFLLKLHSLVLTPVDYVQDLSTIFVSIFRLPYLKSCHFTYRTKDDQQPLPIFLAEFKHSPIEYLVINGRFRLGSLGNIFCCLPQLRYLSFDCLVESDIDIYQYYFVLKYLKYISFKLDDVEFDLLEKLIKYHFRSVEVLRLTMEYDEEYLDAKRWEELIISSMPNLLVFDIHHEDAIKDNSLIYHNLLEQFNSSFWTQRQWFFTHQRDWKGKLNSVIFYSTNPYRRKDYTFYWKSDNQICPHIKENNLDLVKHIHIRNKQPTDNCVNYFPNAIEVTTEYCFTTPDNSMSTILNRMIPLKQLTKLVINCYNFFFEILVELLYFTPNLHTLKLQTLSSFEIGDSKSFQQSEIFRCVSRTNQIRNLDLDQCCTLQNCQLIIDLFPQVEYFKTRMNRNEIQAHIRFLLSKTNDKTRRLAFLCIPRIPKICLREINLLIKSEHLLDTYFIKMINRDLYLWW